MFSIFIGRGFGFVHLMSSTEIKPLNQYFLVVLFADYRLIIETPSVRIITAGRCCVANVLVIKNGLIIPHHVCSPSCPVSMESNKVTSDGFSGSPCD